METTEQYNRYEYAEEEKNGLQDLLKKYLPWWPLFIGLVVLGFIGSWAYLKMATPIYQASATILVKDDDKAASTASLVEAMDMFGSKKVVENEIEVFKSRTLARDVVTKLYLYAPITVDGGTSGSGYVASPVLIELRNLDTIVPVEEGTFTYNPSTKKIKLGKSITDVNKWITYEGNVMRFIPNKYGAKPNAGDEYQFAINSMKTASASVISKLELSNEKHSSVITLRYNDAIQMRAEDILDQLLLGYNEAAISEKNRFASNTLAFVDERLRYVVGELDSVEQNLEKFKSSNSIVDISAQGQQFLQNVSLNDQKLTEFSVQVAVLDKVADYVKSKDKTGSIVPSTLGIADPVLSQLLQSLYSLELEYQRRAATTGENNPVMLGIQEQISKIKPSILETINTQRRNLMAGTQAVNTTSNRYNSVLSSLPKKERELLDISRQQAIKNSIYTYLLEKREETALAYSSTVPDSRVIDTAETAATPVNPKPMIAWLSGFVLAIIAGIAFVEIRGMLNRNVKDRSEIEAILPAPILGEIVFEKDSPAITVGAGKRTLAAEQFRQLRTSLGYLGINNRQKKIMVSSSIPAEGKSFVCANMGVSLALAGKKVVMIELDIRKPQLSKNFNLPREVGVTNYLIGDKEPEEIIKSIPGHENLFLISSGPLPPNPSELIMNGNLEKLLAYLELHFDIILLDTSPVGLVTDGFIISPMCDATLYVVRHGHTPRSYLKKLREETRMRPLKNMAIVFNGIKAEGFSKYSYGSNYKYGYGYVEDAKTSSKNKPVFDKLFDSRS